MSKGDILVTDSLFIFDDHVRMIEEAGYNVIRLDKPEASESELCKAIKGKIGYILGGTEKVTEKVINAADQLKVISFTGAGFTEFIPGYQKAKQYGIAITAAKGGNADAVAEFTITLALMGVREVPALSNPKGPVFLTSKSSKENVLGVIGYGAIGQKVAALARSLGFSVLVHTKTKPQNLPSDMRLVSDVDLLKEADVITLHIDKVGGNDFLNKDRISLIKDGALVINAAFDDAVDFKSIEKEIKLSRIKYFCDHKIKKIDQYPAGSVLATNSQSGFNTSSALRKVSNQTTSSLLSMLETGEDEFRVL